MVRIIGMSFLGLILLSNLGCGGGADKGTANPTIQGNVPGDGPKQLPPPTVGGAPSGQKGQPKALPD